MTWVFLYFALCGLAMFTLDKKTFLYRYSLNALVGLDNMLNACIFLGDPDETISSHAYKGRLAGNKMWALLDRFLNLFDKNHGEKVVEWDEGTKSGIAPAFDKSRKP